MTLARNASALDATRAAFAVTYDAGTGWVWVIDGVGNVGESDHGWVYTVDGTSPGVMSSQCPVHDGSVVTWTYLDESDW